MRIVSWNCCCGFHSQSKKLKEILKFDADIYIIQECANPDLYGNTQYKRMLGSGFWMGKIKFKGLSIFTTKKDIKLERLDWPIGELENFIPVRVNDSFNLLAVWTKNGYIEEFHDYMELNKQYIDSNIIMFGDFNSNTLFDREHPIEKNHSTAVRQLKEQGIEDMYHYLSGEDQGKESIPTFYFHRHIDKPFHIDHCFASPKLVKSVHIETDLKWLDLSDHLPVVVETNVL